MTTELRVTNQSQQLYVSALSAAWRARDRVHDPSVWLVRDPEAEEKMLRDADIAHAIGYRRHLIAGRQWTLLAGDPEHERGDLAVDVGRKLIGHIKHFTAARMALARAFFSGARFARIHGKPMRLKIGDGKERTWWVPTRLADEDKRSYRIVPTTKDGSIEAHWERWAVGEQKWVPLTPADAMDVIRHVYQDDQASLGHGRGLREALGWWWYAKTNIFDESMHASERHGQGGLIAKIDGLRDAASGMPNDKLVDAWIGVLEKMRAKHVLVIDREDSIEAMPTNSEGWQLLEGLRNELRTAIFTLVLGANLTTGASEGGSYALAEVQENSTEALVQFDRETLEETLTDDLLGSVWWHNWANLVELGIHDQKPKFNITQDKKTDPQARATVAQTLHAMGVPLSMDELYEQTGFRKPEDGEDVLAPAPIVNSPSMSSPGFGLPFRS
jgi:hypothetical protein